MPGLYCDAKCLSADWPQHSRVHGPDIATLPSPQPLHAAPRGLALSDHLKNVPKNTLKNPTSCANCGKEHPAARCLDCFVRGQASTFICNQACLDECWETHKKEHTTEPDPLAVEKTSHFKRTGMMGFAMHSAPAARPVTAAKTKDRKESQFFGATNRSECASLTCKLANPGAVCPLCLHMSLANPTTAPAPLAVCGDRCLAAVWPQHFNAHMDDAHLFPDMNHQTPPCAVSRAPVAVPETEVAEYVAQVDASTSDRALCSVCKQTGACWVCPVESCLQSAAACSVLYCSQTCFEFKWASHAASAHLLISLDTAPKVVVAPSRTLLQDRVAAAAAAVAMAEAEDKALARQSYAATHHGSCDPSNCRSCGQEYPTAKCPVCARLGLKPTYVCGQQCLVDLWEHHSLAAHPQTAQELAPAPIFSAPRMLSPTRSSKMSEVLGAVAEQAPLLARARHLMSLKRCVLRRRLRRIEAMAKFGTYAPDVCACCGKEYPTAKCPACVGMGLRPAYVCTQRCLIRVWDHHCLTSHPHLAKQPAPTAIFAAPVMVSPSSARLVTPAMKETVTHLQDQLVRTSNEKRFTLDADLRRAHNETQARLFEIASQLGELNRMDDEYAQERTRSLDESAMAHQQGQMRQAENMRSLDKLVEAARTGLMSDIQSTDNVGSRLKAFVRCKHCQVVYQKEGVGCPCIRAETAAATTNRGRFSARPTASGDLTMCIKCWDVFPKKSDLATDGGCVCFRAKKNAVKKAKAQARAAQASRSSPSASDNASPNAVSRPPSFTASGRRSVQSGDGFRFEAKVDSSPDSVSASLLAAATSDPAVVQGDAEDVPRRPAPIRAAH